MYVFVGLILPAAQACHLDELLSAHAPVAAVTVAPSDTTLTEEGAAFCLRWTVRDRLGEAVTDRMPVFQLASAADSQLVSVGAADGCVTALKVRGAAAVATVWAVVDTLHATATVQLAPRTGPP